MKRLFFTLACCCCLIATASQVRAGSVFIGSVADWAATPTQTLGDKSWVYLGDNGNWSGLEFLTLSTNVPQDSHSLGISALSDYIGPITLGVGYRIDVLSNHWMSSMELDQDHTGNNVTTFKDLYASEADFLANTAPGSGTLASLSILNGNASSTVGLPMWTRQLWVRDTIVIDASGSVLEVSNTVTQVVPEPGSLALAGTGACVAVAGLLRKRRLAVAGRRG